jgi:hypothetical protein
MSTCFKLGSTLALGLAVLGAPLWAGFANVANARHDILCKGA